MSADPHPSASIARRCFLPLLLIAALDRLLLLFLFGFRYVGDDDGIIWSAAVDYAHGRFHEPYFYGQDYAVMLEALVAAPFVRLGIPLHILMPVVTSMLALAPYWSFAFWHRAHGRSVAALVFLAMPVLLPVEFGLMTTVTRCFITGIAPFAALPWILDLRDRWTKPFLVGLVVSAGAFINPNGLVFSTAFCAWYLLASPRRARVLVFLLAGMVPFVLAHLAAQGYCKAHPERMMNVIGDWRMRFVPLKLAESFTMLDRHFRWLFPLLPATGSLAFIALAALIGGHLRERRRLYALALSGALVLLILSFAFPKTHDGRDHVFFPYGRMYLAVPLLLCWGLAAMRMRVRWTTPIALALTGTCAVMLVVKRCTAPRIIREQTARIDVVSERPLAMLERDARHLRDLCAEHHIGLVVCALDWPAQVAPQYRCYLHPVLVHGLPPTYLQGGERRFWQRDAFARCVVPDVLLVGGDSARWAACMRAEPRLLDVSDACSGQLHILHGNTQPIESLVMRLMR